MSRAPQETAEQWHQRLTEQLAAAKAVERKHWERLGFNRPMVPGEPPPRIDEAFQQAILEVKAVESELGKATSIAFGERELLTSVLAYTQEHLPQHDLSATSVASAHQISVRHLYRLVAKQDMSFEQWIITQRLEAIRAALASPEAKGKPVFAIAWAWGFSDPRLFARRFRHAYGVTPKQWQENSTIVENKTH